MPRPIRIIPAIDLRGGRVVRLSQGDYDAETRYKQDPVALARTYQAAGADYLHVVDLDAARDGGEENLPVIRRITDALSIPVQSGGGVRSGDDIRRRFQAGLARVVVGSVAVSEPQRMSRWLDEFGSDALVAALDVRQADGVFRPAVKGWTETAGQDLEQTLAPLAAAGLRHLLVTDISRDGQLQGPNMALYQSLREHWPDLVLQASGGIAELDDLRQLAEHDIPSVIVGKALLEGRFSLKQALALNTGVNGESNAGKPQS